MKNLCLIILVIFSFAATAQQTKSECKKKGLKFDSKNRKCKDTSFTAQKKRCDELKLKWNLETGNCVFTVEALKANNESEFKAWTEKCESKGYEIDFAKFTQKGKMKCDKLKTIPGKASDKKIKRANKKKMKKECKLKGFQIKEGENDTFVCDENKLTRQKSKCDSKQGTWDATTGKCSVKNIVDKAKEKIAGVKNVVEVKAQNFQANTDSKANECYQNGYQWNPTLRKCGKELHQDSEKCNADEAKEWKNGQCKFKVMQKLATLPAPKIPIKAETQELEIQKEIDLKAICAGFKESTFLLPDGTMKFVDSHLKNCTNNSCKCYQSEIFVCNTDKKIRSKRGAFYVSKTSAQAAEYVKNDYKNYGSKNFPILLKEINASSVKVVDNAKCASLSVVAGQGK